MRVLGINGSARKDGNTAILMNTVFEELNKSGIETELVQLSGMVIEPCKACWRVGGKPIVSIEKMDFRKSLKK